MLRRKPSRAAGALVSLTGLVGCVQIFGYEYPLLIRCVRNSDCPTAQVCAFGTCAAQCQDATRDCPTGQTCNAELLCAPSSSVDGGTGSDSSAATAGEDAAPSSNDASDASPPTDAACGDVSTDPTNCGECGNVCPSGYCEESRCLSLAFYGPHDMTASAMEPYLALGPTAPDAGEGQLTAFRVNISQPGWLVQLGLLADYGGAQAYLGLYTNVDGEPSALVQSTAQFTLAGAPFTAGQMANPLQTIENVAATPVTVGDYWIAGIWSSQVLVVSTTDNVNAGCMVGCVPMYSMETAYGPLPANLLHQSQLLNADQPELFAVVAQ